jgi:Hint domain
MVTISETGDIMATTFQLKSALTSGRYNGDYNWNTGLNWDSGTIPATGDVLVLPTEATAYTSVDDLPFIDDITLSIGDDVTFIVAEGETGVENINAFGNNSLFQTDGTAIVSISVGLGGTYKVNGPTASLDITGFNGVGTFLIFSGTASFGNNANLNAGNSFDFEGDRGGNLQILSQNNYQNGWSFPVTNFALNDTITFGTSFLAAGTYTNAYDAAEHTLTIPKSGGGDYVLNNFSIAAGAPTTFEVTDSSDSSTIEAVCYARGTMIRTPHGELPVEKLRPGKQVITLVDGQEVPQTVTWLGHRRIGLAAHPRPETVAPIRIVRDAFADGVPHRDLVVSPDHAIFVDGKLICARQLVNGTTIRQELNWTAVDYYHVELDQHAILLAQGLPAESYLDTGNRRFFANSGEPVTLHPDLTSKADHPAREAGSCSPFVWQEDEVRPVWERLAARAAQLGLPVPVLDTTVEPDLVIVANGRILRPLSVANGRYQFILPPGAVELQLVSRAASPTDARPWIEDRRRLGVYVERVRLTDMSGVQDVPLDHPSLSQGWWAVERNGLELCRWTTGRAVVALPPLDGPAVVEIAASVCGLAYRAEAAPHHRAAA